MSTFLAGGVDYVCRCGLPRDTTRLYWCRHCPSLQCALCVSQEVDSFFCPDCTNENMPSTEAKTAQNCCNQGCFRCPQCEARLMYVAAGAAEGEEGGSFALVCGHCQWNSTSIGLVGDKADIEKRIAERQTGPYAGQFSSLIDRYQLLAKEDVRKQELQKQTASQAAHRKGRGLYTKYAAYKREGTKITKSKLKEKLRDRANKRYDEAKNEWVDVEDADGTALSPTFESDIAPLDASMLEITSIDQVASLDQRLQNLTVQPTPITELWPMPTRLLVKRSKRCRVCLHNMIKPELAPDSIRYKMQLFATLHVPNLTVSEVPAFAAGEAAKVVFQLSNPLDQAVEITLVPKTAPAAEGGGAAAATDAPIDAAKADSKAADGEAGDAYARPKLAPMSTVVREKSRFVPTGRIGLPAGVITIAEHDPVHEYQPEEASAIKPEDNLDPCILKRQGNRVVFALDVTPENAEGDVKVSFCMQYKYKVTTTGFRSTEKTATTVVHDVSIPVELNLGPLSAHEEDEPLPEDPAVVQLPASEPAESAV